MTSDLEVVSYRPGAEDFAWVFGGVPAVKRVRPGTVLELFTEDCFAGRVQGVDDLPVGGLPVPLPQSRHRVRILCLLAARM